MHIQKITMGFVWLLAFTLAHASDLSNKLQSSDHVLLMRHTLAPGVGDPANYTLADCKTQRNLSAEGRQQAVVVGDWLRHQGVSNADVYSSAWCRCKDTAQLLGFKGWQIEPTLASFLMRCTKPQRKTNDCKTSLLRSSSPKASSPSSW